jgi:hypothetical protein
LKNILLLGFIVYKVALVSLEVFVEVRISEKPLRANTASVRSLPFVHRSSMPTEGAIRPVFFFADGTTVRLLLRVDSQMDFQALLHDEFLLAEAASEGPLARVYSHVTGQGESRRQRGTADVAQVAFTFVNHRHVSLQTDPRREDALTHLAR